MSLEDHNQGKNRPQSVDPKFALEVIGPMGQNTGRSGPSSSAERSEQKPRMGSLFGLDALYGKQSGEFVFEGETFRLLRTGHFGTITENFLTATYSTPHNVSFDGSDQLRQQVMKELPAKTDRSNDFFLVAIAFTDQQPSGEIGLLIRREMAHWVNEGRIMIRSYKVDILAMVYGILNHDALTSMAQQLHQDTNGNLDKVLGKNKGLLGLRDNQIKHPSVLGTELRFYYGQDDARKSLTQGGQASQPTASRPTAEKGLVLRREDLSLDRPR